MDKKIVFFDLDGTILDDKGKISKSTKKAVQQLQKSGVYTAIATGRSPKSFEWICKELGINSYVAINGSYVVFEGEEIYSRTIPKEEVERLVHTVQSHNHAIGFVNEHDTWVLYENHPHIQRCFDYFGIPYPRVQEDGHLHAPVFQAMVYCDEIYEKMYREKHSNLGFVRYFEVGMDATPKGSSKAVGIQKMIEMQGFKRENVYAFGDGLNDIEMLSYVGCGIAMGNAVPEVKQVADYITTSNVEDGIAKGLKLVGLAKAKVV